MTQSLEICRMCRRVQWGNLWMYMERCGVPASAIILTPTYCPDCDESYRLLMAYGRPDHAALEQRIL